MARNIIMPTLGMAQDTGTVVRWHKQVGDAVKANDVLMEVETDKATVEIEAGYDGFLTAMLAEVDIPVPVGEVIAIIAESKDQITTPPTAKAAVVEPKAVIENKPPAPEVALTADYAPTKGESLPSSFLRILASPKARVLARERGIDLNHLVAQGIPQPFHVSDLELVGPEPGTVTQNTVLSAQIASAPIVSLHGWLSEQSEKEIAIANIWAAFFLASFRAAGEFAGHTTAVVTIIRFRPSDSETWVLENPDKTGFSHFHESDSGVQPQLQIFDLTATPVSHYHGGGSNRIPTLSVSRGISAESFSLHFEFSSQQLSVETAIAILCDIACRAEQPLRHLL